MADVDHELGSLRHIVDTPLSSKVAMFNNVAHQHKEAQLLNPFSMVDGRRSPKPTFSKDEYGKPIAGSLTEMRGQKASIHVLNEMLELCQIIDSEGSTVQDEPDMKVILFGDLFNIYTHVSDKVVGILLRARKHKLIHFEGEVLFQRRDDDVPVFLLKPIREIRKTLEDKQDEIRRSVSPAPQATTVLQDKKNRNASPRPKTPEPNPAPAPAQFTQHPPQGVLTVVPVKRPSNPEISIASSPVQPPQIIESQPSTGFEQAGNNIAVPSPTIVLQETTMDPTKEIAETMAGTQIVEPTRVESQIDPAGTVVLPTENNIQ